MEFPAVLGVALKFLAVGAIGGRLGASRDSEVLGNSVRFLYHSVEEFQGEVSEF